MRCKTVANITQHDIREFLPIAAAIPVVSHVETYALANANQAIMDLKHGSLHGAKVLLVN